MQDYTHIYAPPDWCINSNGWLRETGRSAAPLER